MRRHATPAALAGLAIAGFLPALWAGFVADDFALLKTIDGLDGASSAFARNDLGESGDAGHFYRPVWVLVNAGVVGVFGEAPLALHALNLLLFALIVVLVWKLATQLLPARAAVAATGIFALYPRHNESVAWISGNTDLIAVGFVLAGLLCLLAPWRERTRVLLAAALVALGAMSKEVAFVTPVLAAGVLHVAGRARPWRAPLVLLAALVPIAVARHAVIGGVGGYSDNEFGPLELLASASSYSLAAITPHELEVIRRPWLLVVPLAVLAAGALALWRLRGREDGRGRRAVALLGLAWFAVALAPVLGAPLDVNNASGERLLMLPSVGLALTAGALLPAAGGGRAAAAAAVVILAALCLNGARSWVTASDIADRTVAAADRLAPPEGTLVVLAYPDSYRNAHIFPNSLEHALARARGGSAAVSVERCAAVHVREVRAGAVTVGGELALATTSEAPFDFPLLGSTAVTTAGCAVRKAGERDAPGLQLGAQVALTPQAAAGRIVYFDGAALRGAP